MLKIMPSVINKDDVEFAHEETDENNEDADEDDTGYSSQKIEDFLKPF